MIRLLVAVALVLCVGPLAAQGTAKWADPAKVLRTVIIIAETGFDPQASQDLYSNVINSAIFEALYQYDYLTRPHKIVPRVADGMPDISADGMTWKIKLRKGIYFADDPAFKGKKRELTADDFVYSWKRLVDPRVRSPNLFMVRGKFAGLDAAAAASKDGRLDYDMPIEGLRALGRYTIQMRFVEPEFTFLPYLTATQMAPVAREVIEAYADASGWAMANPVGTGAFKLKEWRRAQKITLVANPDFREEYFPALPANADPVARAAYAALKGKRIPQIGRIEIAVIEESNPRLLAFTGNELDLIDVPRDLASKVLDVRNQLLPAFTKNDIGLQRSPEAGLAFFAYFNMNDPVVGGYTPDKIALRRAILMGYNPAEMVQVGLQGQGTPATQPIPPEVPGHVPGLKSSTPFDPVLARVLLDKFGYKDRDGDGFRELPDGKPLTLVMGSAPTGENRIRDELWLKNMKEIGIRIDFLRQKWPDLLKMSRAGQLQMWQLGWTASSADSFMRLAYGPNAGETNLGRFKNVEYDDLFVQSTRVRTDAEREKLYARMTGIIANYAPIGGGIYRIENTITQPWVLGYKKTPFEQQVWRYLDIDLARVKGK
ncbi:MAG: ABC transporter substrate-binding protein [Betaproteobacteria bacterium]